VRLEEVAFDYETHAIGPGKAVQTEPRFLKVNPGGRIAAIIDRDAGSMAVLD
jgi:glutathione S-transferase